MIVMERIRRGRFSRFFEQLVIARPLENILSWPGDTCPPNLIADEHGFTGFVGCGRLAIADRYQDLALAGRSIDRDFGGEWVEVVPESLWDRKTGPR